MRRRKSLVAKTTPLVRLGNATPPPFVGRTADLAALDAAITRSPLTVVTGAAGVGKTALARELLRALAAKGTPGAYVHCEEHDLAVSVIARAERALDVVPGTLADALAG